MADTRTETRRRQQTDCGAAAAATPSERVVLSDFAECLLQAYDGVSKRAYQKYVARGYERGRENEDWLAAQQELGLQMRADVTESEKFVHAMVGVNGEHSAEVCVAIEGKWLLVLNAQVFAPDGCPRRRLMHWNGIRKRGARTRCAIGRGLERAWGRRDGDGEISERRSRGAGEFAAAMGIATVLSGGITGGGGPGADGGRVGGGDVGAADGEGGSARFGEGAVSGA